MKLDWDTEIDTPATIAVIGGGPVGIEAALYARFLGYFVVLFDARRIGSRLTRWNDLPIQAPFGEWTSSLGMAALEAQGALDNLPDVDAKVSYREFVESYLTHVAKSDLLDECIHINSPVVSISRAHYRKNEPHSVVDRAEDAFRLLLDGRLRGEFTQIADIVLDCSGDGRFPLGIGPGGGMAIGQNALQHHFEIGPRDLLGKDRDRFVGKHTVMFGANEAASHNAVQFLRLALENPGTRVTWVVPKGEEQRDWLKQAAAVHPDLAIEASRIIAGNCTGAITIDAWGAESLVRNESGSWQMKLLVGEEDTVDLNADVILVTELQDAWRFTDGLSIDLSPDRRLTIQSQQWLAQQTSTLEITPLSFVTSEPHYYVLGRKSVGGDPRFTLSHARQQIQQVFAMIGGRADLDVYQTVQRQRTG